MQTKKILILSCKGGFLGSYSNNGGRLERKVVADAMKAYVFGSPEEMQAVSKLFKDCQGRQFEVITTVLGNIYQTPEELANFDLAGSTRIRQNLDDEIRQYITRSEVWKAIVDHIAKAKVCYIIDRLNNYVQEHRGTGAAVNYRDSWIYTGDLREGKKPQFVGIKINVQYYDSEDAAFNSEDYRSHDNNYDISVPYELFGNFTKKGFDAWVAELKEKAVKDLPEKEMKQLSALMKRYPKGAKALIEALKKEGKIE